VAVTQQTLEVVLDGLSRLKLDRAAIARRAGLPQPLPAQLEDRALEALWHEARRRTRRESLPLEVGLHTPAASFGLIYYLASSAETLGGGLTLLQESLPLATPWLRLSIEPRGDEVLLVFADRPRFPGRFESELFVLGILLRRLQQVAVRAVRPLRVELPERAPADRAQWSRVLDGTPVRFGAGVVRLALRRGDCELPMRRADARLLELLKGQLALAGGPQDAFLAALRALLRQRLDGGDRIPGLAEAAPALGLSTRSLQRKLGAAGTSFEQELDQLRRELAEPLVLQAHIPLGEVAARVGFAAQASFTRAFVRWTGRTPSQARRRIVSVSPSGD
jgi:AraC-like DNA-binding protein